MKNYNMKYFQRQKLHPGVFLKISIAEKFETVRDCYSYLLRGGAGKNSLSYALAIACSVFDESVIRKLAVSYCNRISHMFTSDSDEECALRAADAHADGKITDWDLGDAHDKVQSGCYFGRRAVADPMVVLLSRCASAVTEHASYIAVYRTSDIVQTIAAARAMGKAMEDINPNHTSLSFAGYVSAAGYSAVEKEMEDQLTILADLGNPFRKARRRQRRYRMARLLRRQ